MPLCEWGTSTIQVLADAFLSSPRYVNRNTRRGYVGNPGHWRLATDSDRPPVAWHTISADMHGCRLESDCGVERPDQGDLHAAAGGPVLAG
jgi:hypothetical protein